MFIIDLLFPMWKMKEKKKKKTCTFAGEKFNRWCSLNADSRWQLDSCQTRGKISTRMESGSCWKLRKLGILFTRQTAFGSFRPSCTRSPAQTRLLNIPFVFVRQLCPRQFCRQVIFFFYNISDSILVSDDNISRLSSIKKMKRFFLKEFEEPFYSKKCIWNICEISQSVFERYERSE